MSFSYSNKAIHEENLLPEGVSPDDYGGDFFGDLGYKQWLFRDSAKKNEELESTRLRFSKEKD